MLNLNPEKLSAVVQNAFDAVHGKKLQRRWESAIVKAQCIITDCAYWHMTERQELILLSPDSDEIYETDGQTCDQIIGERRVHCRAFAQGFPCKHRAMHRLLVRYGQAGEQQLAA